MRPWVILTKVFLVINRIMSQIVGWNPYAKAIYMAGRYSPRISAAARAGAFAWNNRKRIGFAARMAGKSLRYARRRRKRRTKNRATFSKRNIGEPVGSGTTKRSTTTDTSLQSRNGRALYNEGLCDIEKGQGIDQRERRIINMRGFKICAEFRNKSNKPMYLNIAVLSTKSGTSSSGISTTDFFRASSGNDRARDFANGLTGNEFHCLPINSDRYTILRHKRYRLVAAAPGGDTVALSGYSYMNLDWWIPLKRQIRYDSDAATNPESGAVYFVYWADEFGAPSGQIGPVSLYEASVRTVSYFHESTPCCS